MAKAMDEHCVVGERGTPGTPGRLARYTINVSDQFCLDCVHSGVISCKLGEVT